MKLLEILLQNIYIYIYHVIEYIPFLVAIPFPI